jgi:molybdate transport system substrate-binding protein
MKKTNLILLVACLLASCAAPIAPAAAPTAVAPAAPAANEAVTLKVFAPSSLTDAAKELGLAFEQANPGVKVAIEFGHSPTQRVQFTQGASGDVFMTASQKDMNDAITDKTVITGTAKVFATNQLVVILPPGNPAKIEQLSDLAKPGAKVLLPAVDVPVGKLAQDALVKIDQKLGGGFKDAVLKNVVSNEPGVKPIVSKIKLGEADAGIVFVSDAVAAPDLKTLEIPADLNMIARFNIGPLSAALQPDRAAAFVSFVMSADGQAILKKWGFAPAKP